MRVAAAQFLCDFVGGLCVKDPERLGLFLLRRFEALLGRRNLVVKIPEVIRLIALIALNASLHAPEFPSFFRDLVPHASSLFQRLEIAELRLRADYGVDATDEDDVRDVNQHQRRDMPQ